MSVISVAVFAGVVVDVVVGVFAEEPEPIAE